MQLLGEGEFQALLWLCGEGDKRAQKEGSGATAQAMHARGTGRAQWGVTLAHPPAVGVYERWGPAARVKLLLGW